MTAAPTTDVAAVAATLKQRLTATPEQLLIDGKRVDAESGRTFESINPSDGSVLAHVAEGGAADIDLAVAAARRAFEGPWRRFKPFDRQQVLLRFADLLDARYEEFAVLDSMDMGAPVQRTLNYRRRQLGIIRYNAGAAVHVTGETIPNSVPGNVFSYTLKEPVGVVGAIIPWNAPTTAAIWKIAPALASGCTLVLKPAEESPLSALWLGELLLEAGLPEGVVNVVPGDGATAGAALAAHVDVDKVAFTGSDATGRRIVEASAGNLKRLSLELGGKSPNIVFADADLDEAVKASAMAAFANSGQICSAGTRLFVEDGIYDQVAEGVADVANDLAVGSALDGNTEIGPLASAAQFDRVRGYLEVGEQEGAVAVAGGARRPSAPEGGFYVAPTVFGHVRDEMTIAREEIFGPVVSVFPFSDVAEVARRANATPFGLGAGVWTRDVGKAHALAAAIQSGSVWVNTYNLFDPAVPFGGYKASGYGRESGVQHIEEYLNVKAVWIRTE